MLSAAGLLPTDGKSGAGPAEIGAFDQALTQSIDGNDGPIGALYQGIFGATAPSFTRTGTVGTAGDVQDYYRFQLTTRTVFVARLSGLSQDLNVDVRDINGRVVASSTRTGTLSESAGATLEPGNYYVRVYKATATAVSEYRLEFRFGDEDTRATPFDLGTFGSGTESSRVVDDRLGNADPGDFYRFRLTESNRVLITLTRLTADVDVELLDARGRRIVADLSTGTDPIRLSTLLPAGTYFVRVFHETPQGDAPYRLQLSFGDDTRVLAIPVGTLSSGSVKRFNSSLGNGDPADFYQFDLRSRRTVTIDLTQLSANLDVQVLNSSGQVIRSGTRAGSNSERLVLSNLAPGRYHVRVFRAVSTAVSDYRLTISVL